MKALEFIKKEDELGEKLEEIRVEKDLIGELELPKEILWGIHTQRALMNFSVTPYRPNPYLIRAMAVIKKVAAEVNEELGYLDAEKAYYIKEAASELSLGKYIDAVVVDPLQGGAGTSFNMNVNEVIANLALKRAGRNPGDYDYISPLEHVNMHQSTNDVFPTAVKIATLWLLKELEDSVVRLLEAFQKKEKEFADIVKVARTHLQDAVLITLGREFSIYADSLARDRWRIFKASERIRVVNIGGTAVGTGIGAPRRYIFKIIEKLRQETGLNLARAENLIEATANQDGIVEVSGIIKTLAANLIKIANDLRFLASGPDAGINEIKLPAVQAGSSIMPGKVNPVIPEMVMQASWLFIAYDSLITTAASNGNLEVNNFMPLIAFALLDGIMILRNAVERFATRCVEDIKPNVEVCRRHVAASTASLTALLPVLGYEKATEVAKYAQEKGISVKEAVLEIGGISKEEFNRLTSPELVCKLGFTKQEMEKIKALNGHKKNSVGVDQ